METATKPQASTTQGPAGNIAGHLPQRKAAPTGWVLPEELSEQDQKVVKDFNEVLNCIYMSRHRQTFQVLSEDVYYDSPVGAVSGRDVLRVGFFLAKSALVWLHCEVLYVKKEVDTSSGSERLHLEGVLWVKPWLLFRQYRLVPYKVPIKASIVLGVRPRAAPAPTSSATTGNSSTRAVAEGGLEIEWIFERWHNLPALPWLPRRLASQTILTAAWLTEPIWSKFLPREKTVVELYEEIEKMLGSLQRMGNGKRAGKEETTPNEVADS